MYRKLFSFFPGIIWFLITLFLFTLPGDQLPKADLFDIPNLDKGVHTFLFFVLCFLFCRPFRSTSTSNYKKSTFAKIAVAGLLYGVLVEFIQKYFIPFRSFDYWDIFFDGIGCLLAYWWSTWYFISRAEKK